MKKFLYSVSALSVMGTFLVAGGDIAPVEPVVETPIVIEEINNGFYIGMAYGYMGFDYKKIDDSSLDINMDHDAFMLQAGYTINDYIAVEGRYWWSNTNNIMWSNGVKQTADVDAWGIYIKPTYPITETINIYALLGYGDTNPTIYSRSISYDTDGFQWGGGFSYDVYDNFTLFIDYVNLYDDTKNNEDITIDSWNFGITYQF